MWIWPSEGPGRKDWMEAPEEESARSVTCLGGPECSHHLGVAAWPLEHKVMDFKAVELGS